MEQNSNVEQLLACLVQVVGRATMAPSKVSEIVGQGRQLRAFNMCDGTYTQGEIGKKLRIDQGNLSRTFARWVENGVAFRIGDGKEVRLMHIYAIPATSGRRVRTRIKRKEKKRASRR